MRKIFFFLLPLIFSLQSPPKVFAVVQKWPVKLHSNSSVSLEGGESNNILFDSDVTTIYNKLTVYADADFDFSTEFELAAKSLEELEVDVFDAEISQSSPPPPSPPPPLLFITSLIEDTTQPKFYASDPAYNNFAFAVSLYIDTALIGAYADDVGAQDSGSVYVFTRSSSDSMFTQQSKLYASDPEYGNNFGYSVALYGDTALIGAPLDDDSLADSGSVYIFKRSSSDSTTFTQQGKLHASVPVRLEHLGHSVALYGNTALIGAVYSKFGTVSVGSVYTFTRSGSDESFTQQSNFFASDYAFADHFGNSVALYEDTALVGAYLDDDNGKVNSGSVYVYRRSSSGAFIEQGKLYASDAAVSGTYGQGADAFGISVALYGNTALIGAFYDDDNGFESSGSVYIFKRSSSDSTTFTQYDKLHASDPAAFDQFGVSVALYGNTALIGAFYDDDNGVFNSGSVYVFKAN